MADIIRINDILPSREQLLAEFNRAITPDMTQEATQMLIARRLPVDAVNSLTIPQFNALKAASNHHCDTCSGRNKDCDKRILDFSYDGSSLIITAHDCQKARQALHADRVNKLIARANIPPRFSNFRAKDYNATTRNSDAIDAAEEAIFDDRCLFIHGDVGTGKTMLACIIAVERVHLLKPCLFVNVPDLLEQQRDKSDTDRDAFIKRVYEAPCLIVDDLGAEKPSDWTNEVLFKIYNRRYNDCKQTVTTSNLHPDALRQHTGERVARRVLHDATAVQII